MNPETLPTIELLQQRLQSLEDLIRMHSHAGYDFSQKLVQPEIRDAILLDSLVLGDGVNNPGTLLLQVAPGKGDTEIRAGIATGDFANTGAASGFIIGIDDSDSDKVKFYFGEPTHYFSFDGTTATFYGVTANWSTLVDDDGHKPDDDATVGAIAGTNLKDSGAVVLYDREIKNIVTLTAGATINGTTLPVPVYMNASDNEVYACDANVSTALGIIGFAISNGTDGNAIKVQLSSNVGGFTGLTTGAVYYVQDAVGTIGITPGTYKLKVGVAISATEIWYNPEDEGTVFELIASSTLRAYADTQVTDNNSSYQKQKEIKVRYGGTITVKFSLCDKSNNGQSCQGQIYVNGVGVGTEQSSAYTDGSTFEEFSEDITISADDLVQLYTKEISSGNYAYKNFRLYWDRVSKPDFTVNTDA